MRLTYPAMAIKQEKGDKLLKPLRTKKNHERIERTKEEGVIAMRSCEEYPEIAHTFSTYSSGCLLREWTVYV